MKNIKLFLILNFFMLIQLCSCQKENLRSSLEHALMVAGDNRVELEKVLNRYSFYPSDSLKYKAACFLIENMPGNSYYEGDEIDRHAVYFDELGKNKKHPRFILDSINSILGVFNSNNLVLKKDIEVIDSAFLCDNIDEAFMAWKKYPWGKNISFNDFCEYILPYRITDERVINWRKNYYNTFSPFMENLVTDDPVVAAKYLREIILEVKGRPRFTMIRPNDYPSLDAKNAMFFNGSCDDLAHFSLFALRSVGIPCTIDFVPICGNYNAGHSWVSFKDKKGDYYTMDFFNNITYVSDTAYSKVLRKFKAYRKTFSYNTERIKSMKKLKEEVPFFFSEYNYRFTDVTKLYSNNFLNSIHIPTDILYRKLPKDEIIYLCGSSWLEWIPLDWTILNKNGKLVFNNQNVGDIVRLATFEEGKLHFLTDPFKINEKDYSLKIYSISDYSVLDNVTIFSKYSLERDFEYRNRMIDGVFEGSNNPIFSDPDTLFIIKRLPYRLITHSLLYNNKEYRYVRYKGPKGSYCNIAEIQFFSDSLYLSGNIIGNSGKSDNNESHKFLKVFDGSSETSLDFRSPDEGWVGLDLGSPKKITSITYAPRNRDNYVREGQVYEFFVNKRDGWESMGVQIATSDSLNYNNVPMGGLYYLKNHSTGMDERIFSIEDGKQKFY